ncbi:MAG: diguanylate cyclase [Lachnospiraceae bacterium]|nr:diguanylate cyclase [Lachnospiraceae bacterium]
MKSILVLAAYESDRLTYINKIISEKYKFIRVYDIEGALEKLKELLDGITAVIIDNPSSINNINVLLDFISESNTYIFAIPALVLTDKENADKDELYLGDAVADVIEAGQSDRIVLNRIERAVESINSVSFSEISNMLKVLPSLIYLKDSNGRYVFCSQYWHHLDNYDDPDWTIRGKTDMEIRRDKENARAAFESDLKLIETGIGTSYVIEENEDGKQEFLQIIKEPLKYPDGRVRGIIAIINNVTEQELLKRELKNRAITDELTGIYNRSYFDEFVERISESTYPLSIITADCDRLKEINDIYGHMVGDEYIRMAVMLFRTILPEKSIMFRTGGDEFVIFLPGVSEAAARDYINKLNEMEKIFIIKDRELSVSFGLSTMENGKLPIQDYIALSDAQMYLDKKKKKDEDNLSR